MALLPLRAFLGLTFVFAGFQKLADPLFLRASAPTSIQSQLRNAAHSSPVRGLLVGLGHHAVLVGVLIALGELAVGAGMLLGLFTQIAAAGGMALSLGFLLSVSWHDHPYYLGPDIFSLFAFTPFVVLGAAGLFSVDALIAQRVRAEARPRTPAAVLDRRVFLQRAAFAGVVAGVGVVSGSVAAAAGRALGGHRGGNEAAALPTPSSTSTTATRPAAPAAASSSTTAPPPAAGMAGTPIAHVSQLPVGRGGTFRDPATGEQAWLVRPAADHFVAFDARCTHQGCPVRFDGQGLFVCPCHGAEFDATTGQVVRGPAVQPLTPISVRIGPDQRIYVDG